MVRIVAELIGVHRGIVALLCFRLREMRNEEKENGSLNGLDRIIK